MNFYSNPISEDTSQLTLALSYEENQTALHCAQKVLKHLMRHTSAGNLKYQRNIQIVEQIIEAHKSRLSELRGPLGLMSKAS